MLECCSEKKCAWNNNNIQQKNNQSGARDSLCLRQQRRNAAGSDARSAAAPQRLLKCFVLVEVLEFIPFRDFNADARAAPEQRITSRPLQFELIWRAHSN